MKPETYNIRNKKSCIKKMFHVSSFMFQEKGITIYLAMLVMGGALAVAFSVSTLMVCEFKISGETVNSLKAVYVADSNMEYVLYQTRPAGTYAPDSNTNVNRLETRWGILMLDLNSSTVSNDIEYIGCPADFSSEAVCGLNIRMIKKEDSSVSTCLNSTAVDCTEILARGSFSNVNRALEISYPNL